MSGSNHRRHRKWLFIVGAIVLVGGLAATGVVALRKGESADAGYLKDLRAQDLSGKFNSDANAIAHGREVCRLLDAGGEQHGQAEDLVAVKSYCPKFAEGFHVLETITVKGSFTLAASDPNEFYPEIISYRGSCEGANGYNDIHQGTQVMVKNARGDLLTSAELGVGEGSSTRCTFEVSFDLTEGEPSYVVTVSHRGDVRYTFAELKTSGIQLSLGE